jgi:uncharacterized protein YkwD
MPSYNHSFTVHMKHGRTRHHRHTYAESSRLTAIATNWAEHMAKTGQFEHNPHLMTKVTKACPRWSTMGENVGNSTEADPDALYRAYMRSPAHRANILDRHYHEIGIATVASTRDGVTTFWNVMDFGTACPK